MQKNKCQAITKKKIPCQNLALKDSDFCHVHKDLFKNFPPVKITTFVCPYCDKPLERNAKFCSLCKNFFLICPYCDVPLRKDAEFCRFCKEAPTPASDKPDTPNYYDKLTHILNRISAKRINISYGIFWALLFLLIAGIVSLYAIGIFLTLTQ
jgi:hypothetical protein